MLLILFVLCVLFLFSCAHEKSESIDALFVEVDSLRHSVLNSGEHLWGTPFAMCRMDSLILVYDEKANENLFHLFDPMEPEYVTSFGRKGQGSDEFIMPFDMKNYNDTMGTVYDYATKKLVSFCSNDVLDGHPEYILSYKDIFPNTVKLFATRFNTIISFGFYDDAMFYLQRNNQLLQKIGEFPYRDVNERKMDNRLKGMAYQGVLQNNISNDRFVYAVNSAEIVYFYKIDSLKVIPVCKYEFTYPNYKPVQRGNTRSAPVSSTNIKTFIDVTATDDCVYMLYSGKNFKEDGMRVFESNVLYVFDWNGKPLKKYLLDVPVTRLCVNKEGNAIYAFANIPETTLVKFEV